MTAGNLENKVDIIKVKDPITRYLFLSIYARHKQKQADTHIKTVSNIVVEGRKGDDEKSKSMKRYESQNY